MSEPLDTPRWLDALDAAPDELRELLRDAATDTPVTEVAASAQLTRILQGVATEVSRPELSSTWAASHAAPPAPARLGSLTKSLGVVAVVGLAALGWSWLHKPATPSVPTRTVRTTEPAEILPPPSAAASPSAAAAPSVPTAPVPALPVAPKVSKPHRAPTTLTAPADPGAEVELIERAQRAIKVNPKAALALLSEHERLFPHGDLVQEREMLAVEALQATGQQRAAQQRGRSFLRRFPNSSHIPRLELLLHAIPR